MLRPSLPHRLYRGLSRLVRPASRLTRGRYSARIAASARWSSWADAHRPDGPLIWIHGASVGELLTAAPVARRLRTSPMPITVVYSHTSASAAKRPLLFPAARRDYLPLDTPQDTARALGAVCPDCIVLARGDLWPEFLFQSQRQRIPIAVIGGAINPHSRRLWYPARSLYAPLVRSVSWIGAVRPADGDGWSRLGAASDVVEVTGDPRHDEVLERPTDLRAIASYRGWAGPGPVLVAGSVEPSDLAPIFTAWHHVRSRFASARLLVVPHDPSPSMVSRVLTAVGQSGETAIGTSATTPLGTSIPCAVHDGVGTLPDLYALGAAAYVGGGFQRGRLHSVIEPAALGVPVLVGPHTAGFPDAHLLGGAGGLKSVRDAETLADAWLAWLADPEGTVRAGLRARAALSTGAADRSAEAIRLLLTRP